MFVEIACHLERLDYFASIRETGMNNLPSAIGKHIRKVSVHHLNVQAGRENLKKHAYDKRNRKIYDKASKVNIQCIP